MCPARTEDYVPVIGVSFFWPLAALLEKLYLKESKGANEVQTSTIENGYSVGIVAIAVFILESAIGRAQYLQGVQPQLGPLEYVRRHFCQFHPDLEELFVLRDVIVHNHLWDAKIFSDDNGQLCLASAELRQGYGNKRFERVVDQETRLTRRLGLNAFPTRIWYNDVVVVLNKMVDFLQALNKEDYRVFNLDYQPIEFCGKTPRFIDLIRSLEKIDEEEPL